MNKEIEEWKRLLEEGKKQGLDYYHEEFNMIFNKKGVEIIKQIEKQ